MADPWAAYSPIQTEQPAPQVGASASFDDRWAAYKPFDPNATEPHQKTFVEKLGETWPAQLAKGVYSAVTLPGDAYQGKFAVQPEKPGWVTEGDISNLDAADRELVRRSGDLAAIASPVSPRSMVSQTIGGPPTREALDAAADAGYNAVRTSGVEYAPQSVANSASELARALEAKGRSERRAPETHQLVNELANPPAGAVSVPITGLDAARQELGNIAKDHTKSPTERAAAEIAKQHIDNYLSSVPKTDVLAGDADAAAKSLRAAQRDYSAARRSETIGDLTDTAERQAARANSGQNVDNRLRAKVGGILDSEKKSYGWSPDELARIEDINNGTTLGNTLRNTGNALGGGGGMLAAIYGLTGAMYNPYVAGLPIAGALLKKGGDAMTRRAITKLDETTRMRSALGDELAAGPAVMTPIEQARQSAMIKALMSGGMQYLPGQQPSQNDLVVQMLQRQQ